MPGRAPQCCDAACSGRPAAVARRDCALHLRAEYYNSTSCSSAETGARRQTTRSDGGFRGVDFEGQHLDRIRGQHGCRYNGMEELCHAAPAEESEGKDQNILRSYCLLRQDVVRRLNHAVANARYCGDGASEDSSVPAAASCAVSEIMTEYYRTCPAALRSFRSIDTEGLFNTKTTTATANTGHCSNDDWTEMSTTAN